MKNLGVHIGQLLYLYDCVIIPGFGGFVGNEVGAKINARQKTISPPSKFISFNKNLTHNDGLLANSLVRRYQLTYDQALFEIDTAVAQFQTLLKDGRRVELETVGALYMTQDGRMHFIANEKMNFLTSAFGLGSINLPQHVVAVKTETGKAKVIAMPLPSNSDSNKGGTKDKRRRWIAAAAVILPFVAAAGYIYFNGIPGGKDVNFASLNPFASKEIPSHYQPRFEEEGVLFDYPADQNSLETLVRENPSMTSVYFSFSDDEPSPAGVMVNLNIVPTDVQEDNQATDNTTNVVETPTAESTVKVKPAINNATASAMELFFIVGGAFKEKSNAEGLVNSLRAKGFDASIFGHKRGLHLVCYGSYTNKAAAKEALVDIKASENKSAWLTKN